MAAIPLSVSFLGNHWDGKETWPCIARSSAKPAALISLAGHDLLVPRPHFAELMKFAQWGAWPFSVWLCRESLHHEILLEREDR